MQALDVSKLVPHLLSHVLPRPCAVFLSTRERTEAMYVAGNMVTIQRKRSLVCAREPTHIHNVDEVFVVLSGPAGWSRGMAEEQHQAVTTISSSSDIGRHVLQMHSVVGVRTAVQPADTHPPSIC